MKNKNILLEIAKELKFDLTAEEVNDLLVKSDQVLLNIEKVIEFNLADYENLVLENNFQTRLREDVVSDLTTKDLFANAIEFDEGYVILKNEKE